jgi:hypothetical protein
VALPCSVAPLRLVKIFSEKVAAVAAGTKAAPHFT